ncbi:flagella [Thermococcus sp. SY098]|uniref:flagella n=1 Tax=Thermococcus sp. SY098 TaxID=3111325 RepID=UPI002D78939F|nr:flagella [Thermococcus sp. SY098]WRS53323.1 flagella [Thermococcus sp. SY098]
MGFSVSASFALMFTVALISFAIMYTAIDNTYSNVLDAIEDHANDIIMTKSSQLYVSLYDYTTQLNVSVYDVTFNITNSGTTLSPPRWNFVYDGVLTSSNIDIENKQYIVPGDSLLLTVLNVPKTTDVHALVVVTETGCNLKFKWRWIWLNQTAGTGTVEVINSAWYCPMEG